MVATAVRKSTHDRSGRSLAIGTSMVVGVAASSYALSLGFPAELLLISVTPYVAYLATGTVAMFRRPGNAVGPLMLATALSGFISALLLSPDPVLARIGITAAGLNNTFVAWLMFATPTGRLTSSLDRAALIGLGIVFVGVNLFDLAWIREYEGWIGVGIASILLALVVRRWLGASHIARRALSPVVAASVLASLIFAFGSAVQILAIPVGPGTPFFAADAIARTLIPFGFLVGLLRLRMARGAVAELVVELGETPAPERLRDALAGALGDPTLEVVYWSPPFRTYLDTNGVPVELPTDTTDRAVTLLERDGQPLAAILHDPALAEDPGLVAAVGSAVRLAVENDRLTEEVRSQLADVRASRTRIVEAADAERRRVERNLHDGAQQRLVALSLALKRARSQLPDDAGDEVAATLDDASEQLTTALAELRVLARGIHPAVLTEAGLGAALRALARDSPVPVETRIALPDRPHPTIEATAYFVAAEAMANIAKYADASSVELTAEALDGMLRVEIADDGNGGADASAGSGLRGLADRVAAVGGRLDVRSRPGEGTRVVARLPLTATEEQRA